VPALLEHLDKLGLSIEFARWGGPRYGRDLTGRWVAWCHGEPVGFLAASIRSDGATYGWPGQRCALLEGIARLTDDDVRNCPHTIVSSLMEAFYEYARQGGASVLVLDVDQEPSGLERREHRFRKEKFVQQTGTRWWWRETP
jgi:hypothetical protein